MNENIELYAINQDELNKSIALLDMKDRIKILEYVSGLKDNTAELGEHLAAIAVKILINVTTGGGLPSELIPGTWHLPENTAGKVRK